MELVQKMRLIAFASDGVCKEQNISSIVAAFSSSVSADNQCVYKVWLENSLHGRIAVPNSFVKVNVIVATCFLIPHRLVRGSHRSGWDRTLSSQEAVILGRLKG